MEQNGLFLLALQQIHDFPFTRRNESRFITPELGFVRSVEGMEEISESILIPGKPYRLTEGRIVYIRSGHIRVRINLREVIVSSNQLVVTSPGAVLEFVEMPKNIDVTMLTFVDDFIEGWQKEPLLHAYLQGGIFFVVDLNEKERKRLVMFLDLGRVTRRAFPARYCPESYFRFVSSDGSVLSSRCYGVASGTYPSGKTFQQVYQSC